MFANAKSVYSARLSAECVLAMSEIPRLLADAGANGRAQGARGRATSPRSGFLFKCEAENWRRSCVCTEGTTSFPELSTSAVPMRGARYLSVHRDSRARVARCSPRRARTNTAHRASSRSLSSGGLCLPTLPSRGGGPEQVGSRRGRGRIKRGACLSGTTRWLGKDGLDALTESESVDGHLLDICPGPRETGGGGGGSGALTPTTRLAESGGSPGGPVFRNEQPDTWTANDVGQWADRDFFTLLLPGLMSPVYTYRIYKRGSTHYSITAAGTPCSKSPCRIDFFIQGPVKPLLA